jgi:hypothetical protein
MEQTDSSEEAKRLRLILLEYIEHRSLERLEKSMDPFWTSGSYNAGRWSLRGLGAARGIIAQAIPLTGETLESYAARLEKELLIKKRRFMDDPDDEDGFGVGAVTDVLYRLSELLREDRG